MNRLLKKHHTAAVAWLTLGIVLGVLATQVLQAQTGSIQRVILQRTDATSTAPVELLLGSVEIPAGGIAGRHSHHGVEMGYVLSGSALMQVEGEAPRTLQAGDSYLIATGKIHDVKVSSDSAVKVLAVYLVEKGKPLAVPAQ